jgi:two-component system CheB/CheR fusion protein
MHAAAISATSASFDRWLVELLHDNPDHAVVMLELDGTIVAWLGAAQRLFGYSAQEAVGMPLARLFTPEDVARQLEKQERELAVAGGRSEDDRWHVRKDGNRFWGSGVMSPVHADHGAPRLLCKILRDRTDVRTQFETLQNRVSVAESEAARRTAMLLSTAHELRNHLGPVRNALERLKRTDDLPSKGQACGAIERQVLVMVTLLNDLADASRPGHAPQLELHDVNVQAALLQNVRSVDDASLRKRLTVTLTVPDPPIVIRADPRRLDQMLLNLLGNALKYTPEGGAIHVSATVEAGMAAIRIEDNGVGISSTVLPHIFELFTRESPADGPAGLGVGLAVVKQLATLHGGFIEARSPGRGQGSVFTLRLPVQQPATTTART